MECAEQWTLEHVPQFKIETSYGTTGHRRMITLKVNKVFTWSMDMMFYTAIA
jgi:hypothetical protein